MWVGQERDRGGEKGGRVRCGARNQGIKIKNNKHPQKVTARWIFLLPFFCQGLILCKHVRSEHLVGPRSGHLEALRACCPGTGLGVFLPWCAAPAAERVMRVWRWRGRVWWVASRVSRRSRTLSFPRVSLVVGRILNSRLQGPSAERQCCPNNSWAHRNCLPARYVRGLW